ncbi:hypothetical protein CLI71_11370 [Prevotella intermedia]|uniref:Uncharacterized protein n=1 Tax=Prevotella intermedia TaxID=28131 RepID=A0A2A6ECX2_PREIN|nr:hypothetical protein CLI71_11370 [Prevotella intermedia]
MFCVPKAAVLHGKSVGFASQKSRFRNVKAQLSLFNGIIFTKLDRNFLKTSASLPFLICSLYANITLFYNVQSW